MHPQHLHRKVSSTMKISQDVNTSSTKMQDAAYGVDEQLLATVRHNKQWMREPKYFNKVIVSPAATMKMLNHANSGVEKGIKAGGKPVEIMGLLLGRPSTGTPQDAGNANTLIVTDCFPLPIEGAETRVLADDQEVINYMITLGETVEETRKERFMGWYHSHPFDVEVYSHCFLSATDVSTQLSWQRSEDPHGNPWLAIVIDPLRTLAKKRPEMSAFRVYPVEHTAPKDETPDGSIVTNDSARIERWGNCWHRYYELEIEYFMSNLSSEVVGILSEEFLWMRTLSSNSILESENRDRFAERIQTLAKKLEASENTLHRRARPIAATHIGEYYVPEKAHISLADGNSSNESALGKINQAANELCIEHCHGHALQIMKKALFNDKFHGTE